jgi:glycosyl hydrolase family 43
MRLLIAVIFATLCVPNISAAPPTTRRIDVLDYFLQKDDVGQAWTINGHDVRPDNDPEGTDTWCSIGNKFSQSRCYEVFKVTPRELQIRWEVVRSDPASGHGNWIRRYEEIGDGHGPLPGHVWMLRQPTVDGTVYQTHMKKDRWKFDDASKSYVIDKEGSTADSTIAFSFSWADEQWGDRNKTGLEIEDPALRLTSEWQREGKIFETYDYARGKGLVRWRWLERINSMPPLPGDKTGKLFKCENGAVEVDDAGDQMPSPIAWKYDVAKAQKLEPLEVVKFKSHWAPELGEQWYVVFRDSLREEGLVKKDEKIAHDFALPEWKAGASIKDLPPMYTTAAAPVTTINPGAVWLDDRGKHVQAHGGGIIKVADTWYWFGEDRSADNDGSLRYVSCYSSMDLTHWKFRNQVLKQSDPENLGRGWVLERPKVFFNPKTKQFVMYMHLDDRSYRLARVAVATCDTVDGDYKYLKSFRPLDHESRDIGQFIDDDGTPYLIFEDRPFGFRIATLSDDYLSVDKQICLIPMHMEGGAVVHYDGLYYAIGSALTSWHANPNKYATAKSLAGPWSEFKDIAPPGKNTYGSQSTMMLKVTGSKTTSVIFMGDIWRPQEQWSSRYLWMPMEIGDGKLALPEPKPWTIDIATGATKIAE